MNTVLDAKFKNRLITLLQENRRINIMPVHKTPGGGYQWGNSGKVYFGKNAKEKAERQGRAAYANGYKGDK